MPNIPQKWLSRQNGRLLALALLCVTSSFAVGIQTAGDVKPVSLIEAEDVYETGDMNLDGVLNEEDVTLMLEIANGFMEPTPQQLKLDPNRDGKITIDDALRLLSQLQ